MPGSALTALITARIRGHAMTRKAFHLFILRGKQAGLTTHRMMK